MMSVVTGLCSQPEQGSHQTARLLQHLQTCQADLGFTVSSSVFHGTICGKTGSSIRQTLGVIFRAALQSVQCESLSLLWSHEL